MFPFTQHDFRARADWGLTGARAIGSDAALVAVIDVLSFTTALTTALDRGIDVFPYRWRDDSAEVFARDNNATLAVGRSVAAPGQISLSPATIRTSVGVTRLVLPSPNGSTISQEMARNGQTVIGVSLRNARAAAEWTMDFLANDQWLAVIPAGERWPDGSLRPAVEDLWGAGAYLAALVDRGFGPLSPEATAAVAAYRTVHDVLDDELANCASGRELAGAGYADDVAVASEVDSSVSVPILVDGRFRNASAS